jgi:hypothetical protein
MTGSWYGHNAMSPDPQAQLGVFILGFHRSGTSAVTRIVNLLGVPLCAERDLMLGFRDNPLGHWESASLARLNEHLLHLLAAAWDCPPPVGEGPLTDMRLLGEVVMARHAFRDVHETTQWAWKDPRLSILLPFWRMALPGGHAAIIVLRHPSAGAASLVRRDRLRPSHAMAMWERYLRLALTGCEGMPTLVVEYDDLLRDPREGAATFARFLRDCGAEIHQTVDEAGAFLAPRLRHHLHGDHTTDALTPMQHDLLALARSVKGAHLSFGRIGLPPESHYVSPLLDHLRRSRGYSPPVPADCLA